MEKVKKRTSFVILLSAFTGVVYTLMYWLHPCLLDDLWYLYGWDSFFSAPTLSLFVEKFCDTILYHFNYDNGRLANIVGLLLLVCPKWISSVVLGFSVSVIIYLSSKIAGEKRGGAAIIAALIVFVLPWVHFMFTIIFASNYVLASAIYLWVFWLLFEHKVSKSSLGFMLGLLVGIWHEAYGIALFVSVASLVSFFGKYRTKVYYFSMSGAILGVLYLFFVPGTAFRASNITLFEGFVHPMAGVLFGAVYYLFVILLVFCAVSVRYRNLIKHPLLVATFTGATAVWLLWRVLLPGVQVTWLMSLLSIIGVVWLCRRIILLTVRSDKTLAVVLSGFVAVHLLACLPWFVQMKYENDRLTKIIATKPDSTIFAAVTDVAEVPLYTLGKPNFNAFTAWSDKFINVVPIELMNFNTNSADSIACDVFVVGNYIVVPYDDKRRGEHGKVMVRTDGRSFTTEYTLVPFKGRNGIEYFYMKIANRSMRRAKEIVSLELQKE